MAKPPKAQPDLSQKVINLCARRGLLVQSGEIYGGLAGFFDYVGYGAQLKRNIEATWWKNFVLSRQDVVGIDGAIITHPKVWEASGHTKEFNDPLVECSKCHTKFRADQLLEDELKISVDGLGPEKLQELFVQHKLSCQKCGGPLEMVKQFNLMLKTQVGAGSTQETAFLRPETAQLIFADFKTVLSTSRKQIPFGIAQVGRSFRNEISPRNFVFRCREFSQMELEFFLDGSRLDDCPQERKFDSLKLLFFDAKTQESKTGEGHLLTLGQAREKKMVGSAWMAYWLGECVSFLHSLGIKPENLRLRQHVATELSHYSKETWDIEYRYPWGFKELVGIAYRTDFDLKQHSSHSGADLTVFDEQTKQKFVPHVIEPSFGLDRLFFTLLLDAYTENAAPGGEAEGSTVVLKLSPALAPVQVGVFPLMKKDGLAEKAQEVEATLKQAFCVQYDAAGSIGKRYARMDEIGTPFCITIDYQTLQDGTVTIRERDSTQQVREKVSTLAAKLHSMLAKGKIG